MALSGSILTIRGMTNLDLFDTTVQHQPTESPQAPGKPRRTRGRTAGVLVGALLVGGGAGLGGAAAYDT